MSYLNRSVFIADLGVGISMLGNINIRDDASILPTGGQFVGVLAGEATGRLIIDNSGSG